MRVSLVSLMVLRMCDGYGSPVAQNDGQGAAERTTSAASRIVSRTTKGCMNMQTGRRRHPSEIGRSVRPEHCARAIIAARHAY